MIARALVQLGEEAIPKALRILFAAADIEQNELVDVLRRRRPGNKILVLASDHDGALRWSARLRRLLGLRERAGSCEVSVCLGARPDPFPTINCSGAATAADDSLGHSYAWFSPKVGHKNCSHCKDIFRNSLIGK